MNPSDEAGGVPMPDPAQVPGGAPGGPAPQPQTPPADGSAMTFPLPPNPAQAPPPAVPGGPNPLPPATQIDADGTTQPSMPQVVDDGDLIEKEWVNKAKQIVARNRNDPHKQSEELTAFRAEYMKKRYNKNIKLDS